MTARWRFLRLLGVAAAVLVFLGGGAVLDRAYLAASVSPPSLAKKTAADFALMAEAWTAIEMLYVDRPAVRPRR